MLASARDLFAERGFDGTTTKAIATKAGVSETVLFRNYGSKEQVFQEAVAQPLDDFLREYTQGWLSAPLVDGDPDEMIRSFVHGLYALTKRHRKLMHAADPNHLGNGAQIALGRLEHMATENAAVNGYAYDPHVAIRAAAAMVITVALFHEVLFGSDSTAGDERIVAELTSLLTDGLKRSDA